jgi:curved DNA-binding protein
MEYKDYYEILGVAKDAAPEVIRRAYRRLAKKYHPDMNKEKGAEQKYKDVNEAWEVLKDPERRRRYDALGPNWQDRIPQGSRDGGMPWTDFGSFGGEGFSDFFKLLFGFGGAGGEGVFTQQRKARPQAQEMELTLSIEDLLSGEAKNISYYQGNEQRNLNLNLPRGIAEGSRIRLPGKAPGGGDVNVVIHIAPHPSYEIEGHDLTQTVSVAPWEAVLGNQLNVTTPTGHVKMRLPAGTQNGQRLRLKGKGLPKRAPGEQGDMYVVVEVLIPRNPSAEERAIWQQLADISR